MKNHAFLILAHKQPKLLARALSALSASNHHFFINVDGKSNNYDEFVELIGKSNIPNVHFLEKRIKCYWGGISLVDAEIELLKAAKDYSVHFDYYHLISGQDYPLRNNEQFDAFFEDTDDSFMCYDYEKNINKERWKARLKRKTCQFYPNESRPLWKMAFIGIFLYNPIGKWLFGGRKPIPNLASGWQWFSWSAIVVDYVLQYLETNPRYYRRFDHTGSPDEIFFNTLLYPQIDKLKIRKHFPLRYISWATYRPIDTPKRPYNLNEQDYERVINSAAFFCRKVDEVESKTFLDMVDAQRNNKYNIAEHDYFI